MPSAPPLTNPETESSQAHLQSRPSGSPPSAIPAYPPERTLPPASAATDSAASLQLLKIAPSLPSALLLRRSDPRLEQPCALRRLPSNVFRDVFKYPLLQLLNLVLWPRQSPSIFSWLYLCRFNDVGHPRPSRQHHRLPQRCRNLAGHRAQHKEHQQHAADSNHHRSHKLRLRMQ